MADGRTGSVSAAAQQTAEGSHRAGAEVDAQAGQLTVDERLEARLECLLQLVELGVDTSTCGMMRQASLGSVTVPIRDAALRSRRPGVMARVSWSGWA